MPRISVAVPAEPKIGISDGSRPNRFTTMDPHSQGHAHLEEALGAHAPGVHHALRDLLPVELAQLL